MVSLEAEESFRALSLSFSLSLSLSPLSVVIRKWRRPTKIIDYGTRSHVATRGNDNGNDTWETGAAIRRQRIASARSRRPREARDDPRAIAPLTNAFSTPAQMSRIRPGRARLIFLIIGRHAIAKGSPELRDVIRRDRNAADKIPPPFGTGRDEEGGAGWGVGRKKRRRKRENCGEREKSGI